MKKYEVRVLRTETRAYVMHIEAKSPELAADLALDQAGDVDFREGSALEPEYTVDYCEELEG